MSQNNLFSISNFEKIKNMKKYLSTIHERSDSHKKNFALAVAGGFTLVIFAIWALANFGFSNSTVAEKGQNQKQQVEPGFRSGMAAALQAIKSSFGASEETTAGLEEVNLS